LLGFPPLFSALIFALITAAMTFVGLSLGRIVGRLIRIRADLLSGIALVVVAVVLASEF
jgi:putative Mn2+ efflux pump MntP